MLNGLHSQEVLDGFDSVKNQLVLERDLQYFFKVTPAVKIEDKFRDLAGDASNQFLYLNLVLKVIEELDIEPVQAFALLEAVRPIIYNKFETITNCFIGKAILPGSKSMAIVFEAIDVFLRLTDTYDSVIAEAEHFGDSQTFVMGGAIHRALSDKARLVLCYQQLYMDVPASVWRHVNFLYRTADVFNTFNQVMPDNLGFRHHSLTVRQLYLYIMLLSCAGTNNINVEEISALAELLKDWVKLVSIKKLDETTDQLVLCIDPEQLSTPVFSCQLEDKSSPSLFCIDLGKLPEKLQRSHMHQKFVDNTRYALTPWTTDKIISNWTQYVDRRQLRYTGDTAHHLHACVGSLMSWPIQTPAPLPINDAGFAARNLRDKKLSLSIESEQIQLETISSLLVDTFKPLQARVIDHSSTGYCLQWVDDGSVKLAIDEVLVLQDGRNGSCCLGQVIWIKAVSRSEYRTGVAIVSSEVMPVLARIIPQVYHTDSERVSKGFVICHNVGGRKYFGILLEPADWQTGQAIELIQVNKSFHARILEPLSRSEKYQSFNIAFFKD